MEVNRIFHVLSPLSLGELRSLAPTHPDLDVKGQKVNRITLSPLSLGELRSLAPTHPDLDVKGQKVNRMTHVLSRLNVGELRSVIIIIIGLIWNYCDVRKA